MLKNDIFYLASLRGVTGEESEVSSAVAKMLESLVDQVKVDGLGNVIGTLSCGKENAKKLVLSAHLDQVGLMVEKITEGGFIKAVSLGVDPRVMLGTKLLILTDSGPIHCCSAAIPPHLQKEGDAEQAVDIHDVWLDAGMGGEDARKVIHPGDRVLYDMRPAELLNDRITGAALDDRVGAVCILEALSRISRAELKLDLCVVFTTMEESDFQGCTYALEQLRPDYFIAVDACHGRTLGCHEYDRVHDLGCGAVISFGMNSRPAFAGELARIAQMERVPFDREAMPGKSFTDAWAAQITHEGVSTAVVSYPLRHMHTPVEVLDLGDAEAVAHLLAAVCAHFGGAE